MDSFEILEKLVDGAYSEYTKFVGKKTLKNMP